MFLTVSQTRLLLVAIGLVAALILAFDLARVADRSQSSPRPAIYVSTPRNTPGSTAHLRAEYRAGPHRAAPATS